MGSVDKDGLKYNVHAFISSVFLRVTVNQMRFLKTMERFLYIRQTLDVSLANMAKNVTRILYRTKVLMMPI